VAKKWKAKNGAPQSQSTFASQSTPSRPFRRRAKRISAGATNQSIAGTRVFARIDQLTLDVALPPQVAEADAQATDFGNPKCSTDWWREEIAMGLTIAFFA
jgi:hypothetical protein